MIDRADYEEFAWSLCGFDERLLGLFAFNYPNKDYTPQDRTNQTLSGTKIPLKVLIVNRSVIEITKTMKDFGQNSSGFFDTSDKTDYKEKFLRKIN